jgi:hypothetical protein
MILIFIINALIVSIAVLVHYEFLYRITLFIPTMKIGHRYRIAFGVFSSLIAHTVEIWIFAFAYYWMHHSQSWGHLEGNYSGSLMDSVYYSFTSYTTLGFGDIVPHGDIRFLTGIESLTGLVLITWTASFLYVEMQRHWAVDNDDSSKPVIK